MGDLRPLIDLVLAVFVAFAGGALAHRAGQPVIIGYLLAGVAIGPFTPGPSASRESVQVLAEIGVALLMFSLGAEVSVAELRRLGPVAVFGGALQIVLTMGLGPVLAPWLGLTSAQGVFLGALLALSSTVVASKVLLERGELGALHGRIALGILIAQDLAVVPMVIVLPAVVSGSDTLLADLAIATLKAAGVLLAAYFVGIRLVPMMLERAAITRTRELFLLGVVSLALGTAIATQFAGLSLAFGAFLAGLVVAESDYRQQVVAEILPLRDLFASLFFVSVGMLIDPHALLDHAGLVAAVSAIVIGAKSGIVAVLVTLLGMPARVAILTGLSLAQVGEFSFVLARLGVETNSIPSSIFDLTLAVALITILLAPSLMRCGPTLTALLARSPWTAKLVVEPAEHSFQDDVMRRHAVICGYGRVGRELASVLDARGIRYLVIEYHPDIARELRERGVPVIYGDAANPAVLEHAHLERARLLAVLMPDANAVEVTTRQAHGINSQLDIVARAESVDHVQRLRLLGAAEVVQPEFEAGQEVIRHALRRFGLGGLELSNLITGRRAAYYRRITEEEDR